MKRIYGHRLLKLLRLPDIIPLFGNPPQYKNPIEGLYDWERMSNKDKTSFFLYYRSNMKIKDKTIRQLRTEKKALLDHNNNQVLEIANLRYQLSLAKDIKRSSIDEFLFFMGLMALVAYSMELIYAIFK